MGGALIVMLQLMATAATVGGIKECTNIPTQLSSHTLRYELLNSKNKSWREEVYSHYYHLNPSESAHHYIPRKMLQLQLQVQNHHHHGEQQQHHHNRHHHHHQLQAHNLSMKLSDDDPNFLRQVSLHDMRLWDDLLHQHRR